MILGRVTKPSGARRLQKATATPQRGRSQPGAAQAPNHTKAGVPVRRSREGYTLTELLIVVTMVGALTLFALPKFSGLVARNKLQAARDEITAAIATARASAVQKGRTATLRINNNRVWVTVVTDDAGTTMTVVPMKSMMTLYNVSVAASDSIIHFDMRGFANPRLGATGVFRLLGGAKRDSVCITAAGQIMPRGCSL